MKTRKCATRGCITRLSAYNPDQRCWFHTDRKPVKGAGFQAGHLPRMPDSGARR